MAITVSDLILPDDREPASTIAFVGFTSRDLRPCDQVYLIERHALVYSPQD